MADIRSMNDAELARELASEDQDALAELVRRYGERFYARVGSQTVPMSMEEAWIHCRVRWR